MNISYKEDYKHIKVKYNPGDIHNILVIDNNVAMIYTLQDVLIVEGYNVYIARDYQKALALSHKLRFDAILAGYRFKYIMWT